MIVQDASSLLAFLKQEPGAKKVIDVLNQSAISTINLSEVAQKLEAKGDNAQKAISLLSRLGLKILAFNKDHALHAAKLHAKTKPLGLSLADRACLATALIEQADVYTADKTWSSLDINLNIVLVR